MSLREDLKRDEGVRNVPYPDTKGIMTIGVGWNLAAHRLPIDMAARLQDNGRITNDDIETLLDMSIEQALVDCRMLYDDFLSFSHTRQDALGNFLFQLGYSRAHDFVITNGCINAGDWEGAAKNILQSKWAKEDSPARAKRVAKMLREG
jgi:lysozyme